MTYNACKGGIPALAYPHHNATSPVLLSFIIKCNDRRAQMTLCLQSSLSLQGLDDEQTLILQYDADKIVSGAVTLGPATIPLPQERLDTIVRAGNAQIRTLSIKLKQPCPVWCQSSAPLQPRPGCEKQFEQLASLARPTHIDIVFDFNWLHRGLHATFQRLIEQPEGLIGFPVSQRYREQRLKQTDWTAFSTEAADNACAGAAAAIEAGDLPPVYAEPSSKRPRQVSSSPSPSSPPPKRVLLSPFLEDIHTGSTEKGTTATPSPKTPYNATPTIEISPLAALSPFTHSPNVKANTAPPTPDLQRIVEQAITTHLPHLLTTLLPRLLAISPTPSTQSSPSSQISHAAPTPHLTALGLTLHDRLANTLHSDISRIYAHTLSHANFLRSTADDRFADMLEEERLALERVAEEKFGEFKQECEGFIEEEVERVGWRVGEICECTTNKLKEEERRLEGGWEALKRREEALKKGLEELRLEKEELRLEKEEFRLDKQEFRRDRQEFRQQKEEWKEESEVLQRETVLPQSEARSASAGRASSASV